MQPITQVGLLTDIVKELMNKDRISQKKLELNHLSSIAFPIVPVSRFIICGRKALSKFNLAREKHMQVYNTYVVFKFRSV